MELKQFFHDLNVRRHITLFRFFAGMGWARMAIRRFNRIPISEQPLQEDFFKTQEKQLWWNHITPDGRLRLMTGKLLFLYLLKALLAAAVVWILVIAGSRLVGKINHLEGKLKHVTVNDFQKKGEYVFDLVDGGAMAIDTSRPPIFSDGGFHFPAVFKLGDSETIFYLPGTLFIGETIYMEDCRAARKFFPVGTSGKNKGQHPPQTSVKNSVPRKDSSYYVYQPGVETKGQWLDEEEMEAQLKTVESGTGIMLQPVNSIARRLHEQPDNKAPVICDLPSQDAVEFIRLAPIGALSSRTVWGLVKYKQNSGRCFRGWMPLLSLDRLYITVAEGGDGLTVSANTLSFRNGPFSTAQRVPSVGKLIRGDKVTYISGAPISTFLTADYFMIQVDCATTIESNSGGESLETHSGWIAVARINSHLVESLGKVEENNKESNNNIADKDTGRAITGGIPSME